MTGIVLQWRRQQASRPTTDWQNPRPSRWRAALRMRLFTLGGFRILSKDPQPHEGAAPAAAIELLKVIVALGGRGVPENKIAAALWPCADQASACAQYDAALAALQTWLGDASVLTIADGAVSLDERHCWVDTWALQRCVARLDEALSDTRRWQHEWQALAVQTDRLLRLYRGDFLQGERARAWSFALRERLRHRFVRTLTQVGAHWRRIGEVQRAMQCCRAGLAVDPLAEPLARLLVQCLMDQGRLREAAANYQDYRMRFMELFGVEPNADTFLMLPDEPQGLRLP